MKPCTVPSQPGTAGNRYRIMSQDTTSKARSPDGPPAEYEAAMADIEQRAARGEITIAQVRREIFALRERFEASPDRVAHWAAQAHAAASAPAGEPAAVGDEAPDEPTPGRAPGKVADQTK